MDLQFLRDFTIKNLSAEQKTELYLKILPILKEKRGMQACHFFLKAMLCYAFIKENGRVPKSDETYEKINIGTWLRTQKQFYKKGKLSEERKAILDALDISVKTREKQENPLLLSQEEKWLNNLALYKELKNEFQREPFRRELYRGVALGSWVNTQRAKYKNRTLSEEHEKNLRKAGMMFNDIERTPEFGEMLLMYKTYRETTGRDPHPRVVVSNIALGEWLAMQDFLYRRGKLSADCRQKLTDAGYVFSLDKKPALNWEQMFFLYQKFKKETGCEPKVIELYGGIRLGVWVQEQRKNVQELSSEQVKRLRDAGFSFDPIDEQWNDKFAVLKEFVNEFDTFPMPRTKYKGIEIGNWLWITQKTAFYDKALSAERQKLLEDIGFSFAYSEQTVSNYSNVWAIKYKTLIEFVDQHHRLPKAYHEIGEYKDESNIGRWYQKQKVAQDYGYLNKFQLKKLKEIENKVEEYQQIQQKEEKNYDTEGER